MSLKLDELRKRLLQQPPPEMAAREPHRAPANGFAAAPDALSSKTPEPIALKSSETKPAETKVAEFRIAEAKEAAESKSQPEPAAAIQQSLKGPPSPGNSDMAKQYQLQDSVAKVFEQTKTFEGRFDELTRTFGQIEKVADAAASVFAPLKTFHDHLAQLAVSFAPLRAFQAQLAQMAQTFEPMKVLHDQVAQLADSFQPHLAQLVGVLDPAKDFRERILALARSFEQVGEIQADFNELYSSFRSSGLDGGGKTVNGLDTQARVPH
jgi:hypothetical protein